jgi:hypothetical protein
LKGGDSGPAIVPGDLDKSLLIKVLRSFDKESQMPPLKEHKKLPGTAINDLVAWIKLGAPDPRSEAPSSKLKVQSSGSFSQSWAFQPPKAPRWPQVQNMVWPKSTIDRFVLAKLEEKRLSPARAADKRTLIRRATFDLTGLPPTPREIEEFLADHSTNAFAKVVERLLASPHYGERWARHWLDVVRYTDSFDARGIGGEADVPEAYRYRDWVVNAFNHDMPYDQFIVDQLAGDILATNNLTGFSPDKLIATGLYVIGEWGTGDADKEKMLTDIVDDQVDVTCRGFLGLTVACARCHDHKFDPISNEDYYALAGIFFSSHILPSPGAKTAGSPVLRLPLIASAELMVRQEKETRVAALEKEIQARIGAVLMDKPARGQFNQPALAFLRVGDGDLPSAVANAGSEPINFLTITLPPHSVAVHPSPERAASVAWLSPFDGAVELKGRVADADDKCGNGVEWKLFHGQKELAAGKFDNGKDQSIARTEISVRSGDLIQLAILPRGRDHACDTTLVELEIRQRGEGERVWRLPQDVVNDLPARANIGQWHFLAFAGAPPTTLNPTNLSDVERTLLERAKTELAALRKELERPVPRAHGLQEGGTPKSAYEGIQDVKVHIRGRYDRLGAIVPRRFPQILAGENQKPIAEGSGRLQLAHWIASPDNPLTARVMVNRIWQHHFGDAIVRTPNNYGKLGTPPTHPELLDYLALEFIKSGWSIKAMHRAIMLSAAYQQSSVPAPATATADPDNQWFGRMNRRRLESEAIRDSLLAVSGNLDYSLGGPSIRDLNTKRRTLYVMTVRSDRSTYQFLFDAADPAVITEKRLASTVSPQALFLLNHPFALTQTKAHAQRVLQEGPAEDGAKIQGLHEVLYGRPPTAKENEIGLRALQEFRRAKLDGDKAAPPELAWEEYCQVLLCANEFVYLD